MRIHADDALARYAKVILNGRDVSHGCFVADEESGFVRCYKRDEFGKFYASLDDPGEIESEIMFGGVQILLDLPDEFPVDAWERLRDRYRPHDEEAE